MSLRRLANLFALAFAFAPGMSEDNRTLSRMGVPRNHRNGGTQSGVAAAKRARCKRRNIAKNPRGAA